ncbi:unnamed protein product [Hermetia illucens]|uniref:DUF5641 domain-containing protein n=1 Tax=Hermetia illucens TaxID=343691 RepID=A0A7R8YTI5_HERIL|nr:unnamed protein product [Hermetia illucens]
MDPNDLVALTPGHFLIGELLKSTVDQHTRTTKWDLNTRWKLLWRIKEEFWKPWSQEYLTGLQQRNNGKTMAENIQEETIVIIKEDNILTIKCPLQRIIKVHDGDDGLARAAEMRTKSGILKRAIHKLTPLVKLSLRKSRK